MAKPTEYPLWATLTENDPVTNTPNKAQPTVEKQNYGQRANKNTLRQDINYLFNKIREWIQFFDEQSEINDVHTTTNTSAVPADIDAQLGGTWDYIDGGTGAATLAGVNVIVFKRIA